MIMKPGIRLSLYLFLIAAVCFTGCGNNQKIMPSGQSQIPRDQMIRLMADLELTESALKIKQAKMSRDSVKQFATFCYDSLYTFYKVTPEQFRENLRYYQSDMEDFQAMMDSVIVTLSRHRDSVSNPPGPKAGVVTKKKK